MRRGERIRRRALLSHWGSALPRHSQVVLRDLGDASRPDAGYWTRHRPPLSRESPESSIETLQDTGALQFPYVLRSPHGGGASPYKNTSFDVLGHSGLRQV